VEIIHFLGSNYLKSILDWNEEAPYYVVEQENGYSNNNDDGNGGVNDDYGNDDGIIHENDDNNNEGGGDGEAIVKLGWSYQKLGFVELMKKHVSKESHYYYNEVHMRKDQRPTNLYFVIRYNSSLFINTRFIM